MSYCCQNFWFVLEFRYLVVVYGYYFFDVEFLNEVEYFFNDIIVFGVVCWWNLLVVGYYDEVFVVFVGVNLVVEFVFYQFDY